MIHHLPITFLDPKHNKNKTQIQIHHLTSVLNLKQKNEKEGKRKENFFL